MRVASHTIFFYQQHLFVTGCVPRKIEDGGKTGTGTILVLHRYRSIVFVASPIIVVGGNQLYFMQYPGVDLLETLVFSSVVVLW